MIKELAFTPHIFDEDCNQTIDWSAQLSRLGERLVPWDRPSHFLISDLYGGGWSKKALQYIEAKKSGIKHKAQDLYTRVKPLLVSRKMIGDWPEDDDDEGLWVQQALNVSKSGTVPLDRIVATPCTAKSYKGVNALSDVTGEGFWNGLKSKVSPPMTIKDQMNRLKSICYHARYISISSAYVRGGYDKGQGGEIDFVKALLEMILTNPINDPPFIMDVHCQASSGLVTESYAEVQNIINELKPVIGKDVQVNLLFQEKIRERILLAGDQTTVSGKTTMKVRWGINTGHVAKSKGTKSGESITVWSLLDKEAIGKFYNDYYHKNPILGPIRIKK